MIPHRHGGIQVLFIALVMPHGYGGVQFYVIAMVMPDRDKLCMRSW